MDGVDWVSLPDGEDWLMRPCLRELCSYVELIDGSVTMLDVQRMNDALDVFDENQRRADAARARK